MKKLPRRLLKEIHNLPDAVQEGMFLPSVGEQVIIRRSRRIEPITTLLTVLAVNKDGLVEMFDEVIGQMFAFHVEEAALMIIKMLTLPKNTVPDKKVQNDITVNNKAQ